MKYLGLPGLRGGLEKTCIVTRKGEYQPEGMKLFIRLMERVYQDSGKGGSGLDL